MKQKIRGGVVAILMSCVLSIGYGQTPNTPSSSKENLLSLSTAVEADFETKKAFAYAYASAHNLPIQYTNEDGELLALVEVNDDGTGIYRLLHSNAESAITIGAASLYPTQMSGYDLTGEGMIVHIWDGGQVRETHEDFENRVINETNFDLNDHATHVMGTVLGGGVADSTTLGIAYKADGRGFYFGDNDLGTMAQLASANEILVSNHSYGLALGWGPNNTWYGPPNANEDYRFGKYTDSESRVIDQIAYNSPYYTIVWAAGNDRDDVGDGSHEPDGQFDCIGPAGVAKNNLTIGAVNRVLDYEAPRNVTMSSFSSWGPTDDGRIKPELVAMGVGVRSTSATGDRSYSTKNGTSMAAPSVAGGVTLLQELYSDLHDSVFMRSSTVKALLAHTALEAGEPGPDYSFGYGLVNLRDAADIISQSNELDTLIIEDTLWPGEVHELDLFATGESPLVATIAWTDPIGTAVEGAAVDDPTLMLVNDLDLRIIAASTSEETFPYILDPGDVDGRAVQADNFRDNLEKVVLETSEARDYSVRVSHKGESLTEGYQIYSLVVTTSGRRAPESVLYWRGGVLTSMEAWSEASGGDATNRLPDVSTSVVLDENSSDRALTVVLDQDLIVHDFFAYDTVSHVIDLNGHTISIAGELGISNENLRFKNGTIRLTGGTGETLMLPSFSLENVRVEMDDAAQVWRIGSSTSIGEIHLASGGVRISDQTLDVGSFTLENNGLQKSIDWQDVQVNFTESFDLTIPASEVSLTLDDVTLNVSEGNAALALGELVLDNTTIIVEGGALSISGTDVSLETVVLRGGELTLPGAVSVDDFTGDGGATLILESGKSHAFSPSFAVNASAESPLMMKSTGSASAEFGIDTFVKLCLDFVDVSGVDNTGEAIISLGTEGTVSDGNTGWQTLACEDVLFPEFVVQYNCVAGPTIFANASSGSPETYAWNFGDGELSSESSPSHTYSAAGAYEVSLTITRAGEEVGYSQSIMVGENTLTAPTLIASSENQLASRDGAAIYQWFVDGDSILGADRRSYLHNGMPGDYQIAISDSVCAIFSAAFRVDVVESIPEELRALEVYPNPTEDRLTVQLGRVVSGGEVSLVTTRGQVVLAEPINGSSIQLSLAGLDRGLYLLRVSSLQGHVIRTVVVQ